MFTVFLTVVLLISRGVDVPESGRAPFRQIFLSRSGAPVNIITVGTLILQRSGKSAHTIRKLPYTRNLTIC